MDDVYLAVRGVNFVWSFILFLFMVHWGLQDLILSRRCGHKQVPLEHYLFATAVLASCIMTFLGTGEVFLLHVEGGLRVFLPVAFLTPGTLGLLQGIGRIKDHREHIRRGDCLR